MTCSIPDRQVLKAKPVQAAAELGLSSITSAVRLTSPHASNILRVGSGFYFQ